MSVIIESIIERDDASWQNILFDLVKNKEIDPWDIDIIHLTNKFLEKIESMDRQGIYISSKVFLIAAILIRLKAEILLESLTKKEKIKKEKIKEKIDLDFIPEIIPKIPFERERKISLNELVEALKKALITEERRIRRIITYRKASLELDFLMNYKSFDLDKKIKEIYKKIIEILKEREKVYFSELLIENTKEEKIETFLSLIHLDFQKKIFLYQKDFLSEIEIMRGCRSGQTGPA